MGGESGVRSIPTMTMPCDPSVAFSDGDIIIADTGGPTGDAQVSNAATGAIIGVAMCKGFTANATINRDGNVAVGGAAPGATLTGDLINVALALPGQAFQGNFIASAVPADKTGVYATDLRIAAGQDVDESSDGYACVSGATANPVCWVQEYVTPQYDIVLSKWKYGREAGVGVTNPRVVFRFIAAGTVFA